MEFELTLVLILAGCFLLSGISAIIWHSKNRDPYQEEIIDVHRFYHTDTGGFYKEIQTIKRTYLSGTTKIITKHIKY